MNSFFANKKYKVIPIMESTECDYNTIPLTYDISPSQNLLFSAIVFFYKREHVFEKGDLGVDLDKLERGEYSA
jgi:hypothetical protein